jgi:hypothetical protein
MGSLTGSRSGRDKTAKLDSRSALSFRTKQAREVNVQPLLNACSSPSRRGRAGKSMIPAHCLPHVHAHASRAVHLAPEPPPSRAPQGAPLHPGRPHSKLGGTEPGWPAPSAPSALVARSLGPVRRVVHALGPSRRRGSMKCHRRWSECRMPTCPVMARIVAGHRLTHVAGSPVQLDGARSNRSGMAFPVRLSAAAAVPAVRHVPPLSSASWPTRFRRSRSPSRC